MGITLTNNEIKDIMKVIESLEDRGIILKGFSNFLRPLMIAGFPLMKSVFTLLVKSALLPFGLSATMSATDAAIQKNYWLRTTALIISIEEMEDIIKIVKSLEESRSLIKGISETIRNEAKKDLFQCYYVYQLLVY